MPITSLIELPRNDTPKAIELATYLLKISKYTPEVAQMLLMLQDSSDELLGQLNKLLAKHKNTG